MQGPEQGQFVLQLVSNFYLVVRHGVVRKSRRSDSSKRYNIAFTDFTSAVIVCGVVVAYIAGECLDKMPRVPLA